MGLEFDVSLHFANHSVGEHTARHWACQHSQHLAESVRSTWGGGVQEGKFEAESLCWGLFFHSIDSSADARV